MIPEELEISRDFARIDIDMVYGFLSTSYWAAGRSRDVVVRSLQNSLCFGAYAAGRQIGFGRAITDRAIFAYLADVFVLPEWRGRGVGNALVQAMLGDPELRELQTILLRTRDAHSLYSRFGFGEVRRAGEMMARYVESKGPAR